MNLLVDELPTTVSIGFEEVQIETDFRTSILFELLMQDGGIRPEDKLALALGLYYPTLPEDLTAAKDEMLWFYRCGRDLEKAGKGGSQAAIYSFDFDDRLIYAAFYESYGIDLSTARLHWWQFRALFSALPQSCEFCRAMGYRSMKIPGSMKGEERRHYLTMKRHYALPDTRTIGEKEADFASALSSF